MSILCVKRRRFEKGSLKGFCDLQLTRVGLVIRDCCWHQKDGREWCSRVFPRFLVIGVADACRAGRANWLGPFTDSRVAPSGATYSMREPVIPVINRVPRWNVK
jgi:hypothetical protein